MKASRGGSVLRTYAMAVALVALVLAVKHIDGLGIGQDAPFLLMLAATVLVTRIEGPGPGLVAAVLGTLAVSYFFLPPYDDWHSTPQAFVQLLVHGAESLFVWAVIVRLRRAQLGAERLAERNQKLQELSSALVNAHTVEEIARVVARGGGVPLCAGAVGVFLMRDGRGSPRLFAQSGTAPFESIPDDVLAAALRSEELVRTNLIPAGRDGARVPTSAARDRVLCAPIRFGEERLGVVAFAALREAECPPDLRWAAYAVATMTGKALERARLYDAEHRARIAADAANRAKDQFLSLASHELRTPLAAITGWIHLLRQTLPRDPKLARGLDVIERNAWAQTRLVDDILDVGRVATGRLRVNKAPVELSSLVRACVDEFGPIARARCQRLELTKLQPARVSGDDERLFQVVRNVLANAVKFTPCGGHIGVEVEVESGATVVLRVRDDGHGIPREELPHVFELFRQVDSSTTRREGGLGLGLAIVRGLVDAHGGRVRIDSAGPERGTTVVVELPLLRESEDVGRPGEAPAPPLRRLAGARVLVVDDEPDAADAVADLLEADGADVRRASSAAEARAALRGFVPDVLVSDIAMPGEDGYSLLQSLHSLGPEHAHVHAVALTAHATPEDVTAAMKAGFERHLAKPVRPEVLTRTIAELSHHAG